MLRQLRRPLPVKPFQQKCHGDADENEGPDPTRIDVDHVRSREQERDATNQK